MKSFREYLTESTKPYNFKVKVAGDTDKEFETKLKDCLGKFSVNSISPGKRTPIQEVPLDFPDSKNTSVTIWEINLDYPVTSHELQMHIAEKCDCDVKNIKVRSSEEPTEHYQAQMKTDKKDGTSLLMSELEDENHQNIVGQTHLMSFIKELEQTRNKLAEVEGINDQLLAKESPQGKLESMPDGSTISPVGSKSNKGK